MTTADMVRTLCEKEGISIAELARRIGQTPQNLNKKLQRETLNFKELMAIADAVDARFIQQFILKNEEVITSGNVSDGVAKKE